MFVTWGGGAAALDSYEGVSVSGTVTISCGEEQDYATGQVGSEENVYVQCVPKPKESPTPTPEPGVGP